MIYVLLAYFLTGFGIAMEDLEERDKNPINARGWTFKPTLKGISFIILTWFFRPMMTWPARLSFNKAVVSGMIISSITLAWGSFCIWGCFWLANHVTDYFIVHLIVAVIAWFCLSIFIMPFFPLLMNFIMLPFGFLLGFLFPQPDTTKDINWCRNCQHYKKSKEFENLMKGLWQSPTIPQSDKLPCTITLETAEVWKAHFGLDPNKNRTMFPKECPRFVRKPQ